MDTYESKINELVNPPKKHKLKTAAMWATYNYFKVTPDWENLTQEQLRTDLVDIPAVLRYVDAGRDTANRWKTVLEQAEWLWTAFNSRLAWRYANLDFSKLPTKTRHDDIIMITAVYRLVSYLGPSTKLSQTFLEKFSGISYKIWGRRLRAWAALGYLEYVPGKKWSLEHPKGVPTRIEMVLNIDPDEGFDWKGVLQPLSAQEIAMVGAALTSARKDAEAAREDYVDELNRKAKAAAVSAPTKPSFSDRVQGH